MTDGQPVTFTEDRIPFEGMNETLEELVELYGGEVVAREDQRLDLLRRERHPPGIVDEIPQPDEQQPGVAGALHHLLG